jgi:fibronectin type 3 domain-containing protein
MQVMDVPGTVANLLGEMDQGQIQLHWQPPAQNSSLAEIYLVRRQDWDASQNVREPRFVDPEIEAGKTYQYVISAARDSIPPVPGPPSAPLSIIAVDKIAPRVPTGLQQPVISETGAFLRWDRNTETDIAGYRVYRSDNPDTGFMALEKDVRTTPSFRDPDYRPGSYYKVSAEDDSGNESDKSAPVRAQE